jgi:hypothetical protein
MKFTAVISALIVSTIAQEMGQAMGQPMGEQPMGHELDPAKALGACLRSDTPHVECLCANAERTGQYSENLEHTCKEAKENQYKLDY